MRVTYVTHNDAGSPLVRSQVLPYLRGLAQRGVEFTLVTYERGAAFPEGEYPRNRWIGLRPVRGSSLLAKVVDAAVGVATLIGLALRGRASFFHARSYLPAAMAAVAGGLTRRPFIFDMRGFLGEEYVDAGHWSTADVRYRVLRAAEGLLLRRAGEIVVLTERAAERLRSESRYAAAVARSPVTVVPCAVELERFRPAATRSTVPTLVYSGSLGMWYLLDEMLRVFTYARALVPDLRFLILNRSEHDLVRRVLARRGLQLGEDGVDLEGLGPAEMPERLARAHVGIALLRQVPSKVGSSPVKIAEYLACGLPVIVNADLGDADRLVARYRAGHVVPRYDDESLRRAGDAVAALVDDNVARRNARALAEAEYDLTVGVERYATIYERLARSTDRRRGGAE